MTLSLKLLNEKNRDEWEAYVEHHPYATFFHRWAWRDILFETYSYTPFYFGLFRAHRLCGILPLFKMGFGPRKRWISIPFADYAGPLTDGPEMNSEFLDRVSDFLKGGRLELLTQTSLPLPEGWSEISPFCSFRLPVDLPFDALLKKYVHRKTRELIRKAARAGITTERFELSSETVSTYYPLFYRTLLRLKKLAFPQTFFESIGRHFPQESKLFISFSPLKNHSQDSKKVIPVAGMITFRFKNTLYLLSNGSHEAFLSVGCNNAVYGSVLDYACADSDIQILDFGSTIRNTPHHFFKKRWGGEEYPLFSVQNHPQKPNEHESTSSPFQTAIATLLSPLPSRVVQTLTRLAYRYY